MRIKMFSASVCLTLLATVAAAQDVTYDYDHAADFSKYKTYGWTQSTGLANELYHLRVVREVEGQLGTKGLSRVQPDATPDVLVAYHASFERNLEVSGSVRGAGAFGVGAQGSAASDYGVLVGTLVVDLVDAKTGVLVWHGLASSDIKSSEGPESREKKIEKATARMFRNYPPKR